MRNIGLARSEVLCEWRLSYPTRPMPDTAVGVGFGAFSPIRSVVSHRLQSAVSVV